METYHSIINRLEEYRDNEFLVYKGISYLYADLINSINNWFDKIKRIGIEQGQCISIIGEYSFNAFSLFLALQLNNNIIVPISTEAKHLKDKIFDVACVDGYFESSENDEWNYTLIGPVPKHPLLNKLILNHEPGLVIFTSGTTGEKKGAVIQILKLISKFDNRERKPYRSLIFMKLDHIGGVNTFYSIIYNGGTIITAEDRTPELVCSAIEENKVELLPTTPTFLNMLVISGIFKLYDLSSLKVISYGTEPMPQSTLRVLNTIFPSIILKQTYGLTELGIFATKSRESDSTWMKIGGDGVETRIVNNTLFIRTKSAMLGYLNAPSPFDEEGWYNTGDQVEIDGDYLKILGRKEDVINVGGDKVHPAEVESVLLEIPNIKEVIVYGKDSPVVGKLVAAKVVLINPEDIQDLKKRIYDFCRLKLQKHQIPRLISISEKNLVNDQFKKKRELN